MEEVIPGLEYRAPEISSPRWTDPVPVQVTRFAGATMATLLTLEAPLSQMLLLLSEEASDIGPSCIRDLRAVMSRVMGTGFLSIEETGAHMVR